MYLFAVLHYDCIDCVAEDKQPDTPSSEKSAKSGPNKAPKPQVEKAVKAGAVLGKPVKPNLSIKTSLERPPKSQDKATKTSQSSDKANKSPPPPPPRRNYVSSTGVTTTRSGEVVYTCRKESGSAQVLFVFVCVCALVYIPMSEYLWNRKESYMITSCVCLHTCT